MQPSIVVRAAAPARPLKPAQICRRKLTITPCSAQARKLHTVTHRPAQAKRQLSRKNGLQSVPKRVSQNQLTMNSYRGDVHYIPNASPVSSPQITLTGFPRDVNIARTDQRPIQGPRSRQERLSIRYQKGLLRPREEIPPRHEQRPASQRPVRRNTVRLRDPLRSQEEGAI